MKRFYDTRQWRKIRLIQLSKEPLCRLCEARGKITPATIVDHVVPHDGDWEKFTDMDNLQSLCASCHSGIKRIKDKGGIHSGCDVDGMPSDQDHWWNQ